MTWRSPPTLPVFDDPVLPRPVAVDAPLPMWVPDTWTAFGLSTDRLTLALAQDPLAESAVHALQAARSEGVYGLWLRAARYNLTRGGVPLSVSPEVPVPLPTLPGGDMDGVVWVEPVGTEGMRVIYDREARTWRVQYTQCWRQEEGNKTVPAPDSGDGPPWEPPAVSLETGYGPRSAGNHVVTFRRGEGDSLEYVDVLWSRPLVLYGQTVELTLSLNGELLDSATGEVRRLGEWPETLAELGGTNSAGYETALGRATLLPVYLWSRGYTDGLTQAGLVGGLYPTETLTHTARVRAISRNGPRWRLTLDGDVRAWTGWTDYGRQDIRATVGDQELGGWTFTQPRADVMTLESLELPDGSTLAVGAEVVFASTVPVELTGLVRGTTPNIGGYTSADDPRIPSPEPVPPEVQSYFRRSLMAGAGAAASPAHVTVGGVDTPPPTWPRATLDPTQEVAARWTLTREASRLRVVYATQVGEPGREQLDWLPQVSVTLPDGTELLRGGDGTWGDDPASYRAASPLPPGTTVSVTVPPGTLSAPYGLALALYRH